MCSYAIVKNYSDIELIIGCQKKLLEYQEALYRQYYSDLIKVCYRYMTNEDDANIALNDSFLKIFKNIPKYEATGSFRSWMKRIVINTCLDVLKSKSFRKQKETYEIMEIDLGNTHNNIEKELISKYNYDELLGFIQDLEDTERLVFNLYVFEEYNHRQIAEELGFSENTSSWYLYKARKKLKSRIKKSNLYLHLN